MALGPQQLTGDTKRLKHVESKIDTILRSSRETSHVTISISLLDISYPEFQKVLRPKYLKAGWKTVKWESDQRDGAYLDFQAP